MDAQRYMNAVSEAKRFLLAAERLEKECDLVGEIGPSGIPAYYPPSKQTGAVRRASMDLTRALAELRQG